MKNIIVSTLMFLTLATNAGIIAEPVMPDITSAGESIVSENAVSENAVTRPSDIRAREEENIPLEPIRFSCYIAPPGARCYDGTIPYEGEVACNVEHLGKMCIVYDLELNEIARFECHDIGGNYLLRQGRAIDIYRNSLDRCWEFVGKYGDHGYVRWMDIPEATEDTAPTVIPTVM